MSKRIPSRAEYLKKHGEEQRRVVAAAQRVTLPDGSMVVVMSVRHCDVTYSDVILRMADRSQVVLMNPEQGFIDNVGVFMTRAEAWRVAEAAGQIRYEEPWNTKDGVKILYSENLY